MTTAKALNLFIPITKVDAAQRLVYGLATAETEDRSGETCDYATTKPHYEKWSGDIHKSTGGKSMGNVRAMHGKVAAGKVTAINFNDDLKQIEICAKVVDDAEWAKVEEGVYTGFSQGGAYVKRWKDENGVQRYTADPHEVSLVDLPCLPSATFEMIKSDGAHEMRKFVTVEPAVTVTNDQIVAKATELAKAAGAPSFADFIEPARAELIKAAAPAPERPAEASVEDDAAKPAVAKSDASAAADDPWEQVWLSKRDGKTFKTKAELRKHHDALDAEVAAAGVAAPIQSSLDALNAALGIEKAMPAKSDAKEADDAKDSVDADAADAGQADKGKAGKKGKPKKAAGSDELRKGLYDVGRFASLLAELNYLQRDAMYEAMSEDDGSTVPDQIKSGIAALCSALRAMVVEETTELFDPENENDALLVSVMEMSAGMPPDHMKALVKFAEADEALVSRREQVAKAGARNAKQDQVRIQTAHDNLVAAGADCSTEKLAGDDMAKAASELSKEVARGDALQKALDAIQPQIDAIQKSVTLLLDQPVPHPLTRIVTKAQDNGGTDETGAFTLDKATPEQLALQAFKLAQQNGHSLLKRGV